MPRSPAPAALLALASLTMTGNSPLTTASTPTACENGVCTTRLTAAQLLQVAERMVLARDFEQARPIVTALAQAPEMQMQAHFLNGYIAAETGDLKTAAREFRTVLRDRPDVTRARLELARTLELQGRYEAADHHYRLASEDNDLPPEIEATIRRQRGILRNARPWRLNVDVGLAPDSNINNATAAQSVDTTLTYGSLPIVLDLDREARRRSGVGQTGSVSTGVRLRLSDGTAMLVDFDGQVVNYKGTEADDVSALLAAGPELTFSNGARVAVQAEAASRWYGGKVLARGPGVKLSYQQNLDHGARIGAQVDVRHSDSGFGPSWTGWQYSASATYEQVVRRSMVASGTVFARRDDFRSEAYSSKEVGVSLGMGGELPLGINAGLSGSISRALFDGPMLLFSSEPRRDWRMSARAYAGLRSIRALGFSPSAAYTYSRVKSTLPLYRTDRHRIQFSLARYF